MTSLELEVDLHDISPDADSDDEPTPLRVRVTSGTRDDGVVVETPGGQPLATVEVDGGELVVKVWQPGEFGKDAGFTVRSALAGIMDAQETDMGGRP